MPPQGAAFDWYPKIVKADRETEVTIQSSVKAGFNAKIHYEIEAFAQEQSAAEGRDGQLIIPLPASPGTLRFCHSFAGEQEHALSLYARETGERRFVTELKIYSLAPNLHSLRAYKGDFHMHSSRSDGCESPAYVAGASRRIGLDFMAVTDHSQYAPSLEAIAAFADLPIDLRIYPGEEIHPPDNPQTHFVNFGGRGSVNELFSDLAVYQREVAAIETTLAEALSPRDRYLYASSLWCYEKIHAAGGLAIFCHPYWISHSRYCVPEAVLDRHFADKPFDALELIGGFYRPQVESNVLQVARYQEERAQGRRIPIVGASDAHGCERGELFGWYFTLVFSPSPELPDLIKGIKHLNSVAVETLPNEAPRIHGPFRLVKYAAFLLREVFPAHDALCRREGELMLAHLAGDQTAKDRLRPLQGQTQRLWRHYWG
jgi:predicted metal-dependent phosphoesterase TrpH